MEASISEYVGLAGFGVKIIKDAYRNAVKYLGKKKAKALLSEAVRETLKINPDLAVAWTNIMKSERLAGKEDLEYVRARSLFAKVKAYKPVRMAKAKVIGPGKGHVTFYAATAKLPAKPISLGKRPGLFLVSVPKAKKGTRKIKKQRKK